MPHVWYAIPSHRDSVNREKTLPLWRNRGFRVAVLIDDPDMKGHAGGLADLEINTRDYRGYPWAVKQLCDEILSRHPDTNVIVTGGDDISPDPRYRAEVLEAKFLERFPDTFGVMQPCGDSYGTRAGVPAAARICGSPWMGREFIRRINGGRGPFWGDYFHFYCDEEMHEVAKALGILWNNYEVNQHHAHWSRDKPRRAAQRPSYLFTAQATWESGQGLFNRRKAAGFPGHEPLPARI